MTAIERLKIELSNKQYFSDETFTMYLEENELDALAEYHKETMQRNLLMTVIDILEALSNDIDLFRTVQTEFSTVSQAYQFIEKRINDINKRILTLSDDENDSVFSQMYFN